jgi:hypothetical protein
MQPAEASNPEWAAAFSSEKAAVYFGKETAVLIPILFSPGTAVVIVISSLGSKPG